VKLEGSSAGDYVIFLSWQMINGDMTTNVTAVGVVIGSVIGMWFVRILMLNLTYLELKIRNNKCRLPLDLVTTTQEGCCLHVFYAVLVAKQVYL